MTDDPRPDWYLAIPIWVRLPILFIVLFLVLLAILTLVVSTGMAIVEAL